MKAQVTVNAATRLKAARADTEQAKALLQSIGFKGLAPSYDAQDVLKFTFTKFSPRAISNMLGQPKSRSEGAGMSWAFGNKGAVNVWPDKNLVILRNRAPAAA